VPASGRDAGLCRTVGRIVPFTHFRHYPPMNEDFWKRKLAAYLHDPPSKALDIKTHGERSEAAFRAAGFTDTEVGDYFRHADHTGAAIDRIPFPKSLAANIACAFDGVRNSFLHPLGAGDQKQAIKCGFHREFATAELAIEGEQTIQPVPSDQSLAKLKDEAERWRARFFAHWRLWRKHAVEHDYRLGFLPADTRIPDHSIWTHMQVVSALAGCVQEEENHQQVWHPAFLKFQIGPVQEFIAQARSIRDLWSGSYLLSWLVATALKRLSELAGPDAVIYPNLQGQPLFDLQWRDELWSKVQIGNGSQNVWESLGHENEELLTPNLPNVFLAVVPAQKGEAYAKAVAEAIQQEWKTIANAVWKTCDEAGLTATEGGINQADRKKRFDRQVQQFLAISWQVTPWPETLEQALQLAEGFAQDMPISEAKKRVEAVIKMASREIPKDHRDGRFYEGGDQGPKVKLNNLGLGWSVVLALNGWQLDAVRQTRSFDAANQGRWQVGTFCNKDALNGKDEAVAGGTQWVEKAQQRGAPWSVLFKHDDWMGAVMLVKRLWHLAYLKDVKGLKSDGGHFKMPNTHGIAGHMPFSNADEEEPVDKIPASEKYFAVLALDGDQIGKWMSGEKTPPFATQLADYTDAGGKAKQGVLEYFERDSDPDSKGHTLKQRFADFLQTSRPLSASYHLQFSETLGNFALYCARPIVEAFDGRLIYAGGDDVVALLPADTALACAKGLRMAFKGDPQLKEFLQTNASILKKNHEKNHEKNQAEAKKPNESPYYQKLAADGVLLDGKAPGFLCRLDKDHQPIPFLVPGPAADCSVGIAIAHFKSPLQDVVRAAQAAEKRAKRQLGRSAVAIALMKRSGEILEWGCQWDSGGLELLWAVQGAMDKDCLSAKFPHRVIEFLEPYLAQQSGLAQMQSDAGFNRKASEIIQQEIGTAANRQRGSRWSDLLPNQLRDKVSVYIQGLAEPQAMLKGLVGLMQTVAFANRTSPESNSNPEPKGTA